MSDGYENTTREGHGQEDAHHGRSLAEALQDQASPTGGTRVNPAASASLPGPSRSVSRPQSQRCGIPAESRDGACGRRRS
jgi:hypothetical protein